jgi:hypothetical protein
VPEGFPSWNRRGGEPRNEASGVVSSRIVSQMHFRDIFHNRPPRATGLRPFALPHLFQKGNFGETLPASLIADWDSRCLIEEGSSLSPWNLSRLPKIRY